MILCDLYRKELWKQPYVPVIEYYYRRTFPPDYRFSSHTHSAIEVMYVEHGEMSVEVEGEAVHLQTREFVVINTEIPHGILSVSKNCRVINCEFFFQPSERVVGSTLDVVQYLNPSAWPFRGGDTWVIGRDTGYLGATLRELIEELNGTLDDPLGQELLLRLNFWRLIIYLSRMISHSHNITDLTNWHVNRAVSYIRANYHRPELSVAELSEYLQLNRSHVSRIFKEITGKTPSEFISSYRISIAKKLLATTDMSIIDICQEIGISSEQYFSRLFSKKVGISPRSFRRSREVLSAWPPDQEE